MHTTLVQRSPLATVAAFAHGPHRHVDPDEETFARPVVVFTTDGRWRLTGRRGWVDVDPRVVVLGRAGETYRCAHEDAHPTDRTTYVAIDHERLGYDPLPTTPVVRRTPALAALLAALAAAREPLHADALVLRLALELRGARTDVARPRHAAVAAARELLEASVERGITLLELARAVHVSPYHLHRLFRDEVGVPPHEYLLRLRIRRACELLDRGATVTEAATASGFNSTAYFATVFRRRLGTTPSAYRRCRTQTFGST
jgi:AraC-like DNA-binding protein